MREIKFRAWDSYHKEFVFDVQATYDNQCRGKGSIHHESFQEVLEDEDCIVEQFTGLKDKNGKEIYDGDIIQEEIDFNCEITDGRFKYRVYWDEEVLCWALDPIGKESIHDELWETNLSRRVIGNIHENPELLEGKL